MRHLRRTILVIVVVLVPLCTANAARSSDTQEDCYWRGSPPDDAIPLRVDPRPGYRLAPATPWCLDPPAADATGDSSEPPTDPLEPVGSPYDAVVAVGSEDGYRCSGTLVHELGVLTAAHCLPATQVLFGYSIERPSGLRQVVATHRPDGDPDVALLVLDEAVERVRPMALPHPRGLRPPSGSVQAIGFGAMNPTGRTPFGDKRIASLHVTSWGCSADRSARVGCDPDTEMVIQSLARVDTCTGDSGGALLASVDPGGEGAVLLGITSRSVGWSAVGCGDGGIYVRVDKVYPWLEHLLGHLDLMRRDGE